MGDVSYSFMRIIISRQIKKEVDELIKVRKAQVEALDKDDPKYTEKVLSLSVILGDECKKIALDVLSRYEKEVKADSKLQEYKRELTKNGA